MDWECAEWFLSVGWSVYSCLYEWVGKSKSLGLDRSVALRMGIYRGVHQGMSMEGGGGEGRSANAVIGCVVVCPD